MVVELHRSRHREGGRNCAKRKCHHIVHLTATGLLHDNALEDLYRLFYPARVIEQKRNIFRDTIVLNFIKFLHNTPIREHSIGI